VIQKIVSQESTTENLINVTRENQAKMEALQEMKKKIKMHCEELKYSGVGGGQHRKMVDSYEDQLSSASQRLERSRLKYERLNKIVISMKAGVGHLQDKLEAFREEIQGKTLVISDETVNEALHESDLCFQTLLKRIKAGEEEVVRNQLYETMNQTNNASVKQGQGQRAVSSPHGHGPMLTQMDFLDIDDNVANLHTLRPYNQRIDLNATEDPPGSFDPFNSNTNNNNDLDDLDDDELTREKVKRASTQILNAMDKKKKKSSKKNKMDLGSSTRGFAATGDDESVASGAKSPAKF
jgi:coiled-coil domain-containing protein 151